MSVLNSLANNPVFNQEVEELAQDIYATYSSKGMDVPIAKCWLLAVDTLLSDKGFELVRASPKLSDNIIKLRKPL